jgi:hypothetical protein
MVTAVLVLAVAASLIFRDSRPFEVAFSDNSPLKFLRGDSDFLSYYAASGIRKYGLAGLSSSGW